MPLTSTILEGLVLFRLNRWPKPLLDMDAAGRSWGEPRHRTPLQGHPRLRSIGHPLPRFKRVFRVLAPGGRIAVDQ